MLRDLTIQGSCTGILDIPHVLDKLTRLSLESMPPMDFTVASILARTPHLKELYIDGFVGNHLISALSEMNPSELDGHPQLVPELSVLRLFATPLFSVVTFKNMVHKRNLLGRPLYVSCALHLASNVRYTFSGYKRTTCIQSGEYFSIDRVKELDEETKFSEKVQALVEAFVEPAQFMQNATQYDILLSGIESNASMTDNVALSAEEQSALDRDLNIDPASFYSNEFDVLGQFPLPATSVSSDVEFFGQFYDSNIKGPTYRAAHSHGMSAVSSIPTFSHNQQQPTTYLPHSSRTFPFGTVLSELTQPGPIHESPQIARTDQHSSWGLTSTLSPLAENENTSQGEESSPGSGLWHYDQDTGLYFDVPGPLTAESRSSNSYPDQFFCFTSRSR
uniref:Uncharacterized protein n=1 Tax=Moniliophthora roreri TaxID=221103 RepID=A0A0W0G827_MONRR